MGEFLIFLEAVTWRPYNPGGSRLFFHFLEYNLGGGTIRRLEDLQSGISTEEWTEEEGARVLI